MFVGGCSCSVKSCHCHSAVGWILSLSSYLCMIIICPLPFNTDTFQRPQTQTSTGVKSTHQFSSGRGSVVIVCMISLMKRIRHILWTDINWVCDIWCRFFLLYLCCSSVLSCTWTDLLFLLSTCSSIHPSTVLGDAFVTCPTLLLVGGALLLSVTWLCFTHC